MPVNPQYLAARALEHRRRLSSYLPSAEPLALPLRNGRIVHLPQAHLTVRAMLELELIASPFLVGGTVSWVDAYRYLWRMHPAYTRRRNWRAWLIRVRLSMVAVRLLQPSASALIRARMDEAWQDELSSTDRPGRPRRRAAALPQPCLVDDLVRMFAEHGLPRDLVLDSPISCLLQFVRSAALAEPDGFMEVTDPSAALL